MTRLHDFQRVMHEALLKIGRLKHSSMVKFEASSKLRELQVKKEQSLQKITLYKNQLKIAQNSIDQLKEFNKKSKIKSNHFTEKLKNQRSEFKNEKLKYEILEKSLDTQWRFLNLDELKLKKRQKQMIIELSSIFPIEQLNGTTNPVEGTPTTNTTTQGSYTRNRMKIININFRSYNSSNLTVKNVEHQNAVVLGYIIHSITMIANILSTPLRHPVIFRGSKSFIIEQLNPESHSEFPLFKQNSSTQDSLFAHAVTLLNKNLSQLRITFDNYKNIDTNDMLGNLKWIFENL